MPSPEKMSETEQKIAELDAILAANPNDADSFFKRGELKSKLGMQAAALSDFVAAAHLDPNGPGAAAADMMRSILDFYHRDLYNP